MCVMEALASRGAPLGAERHALVGGEGGGGGGPLAVLLDLVHVLLDDHQEDHLERQRESRGQAWEEKWRVIGN